MLMVSGSTASVCGMAARTAADAALAVDGGGEGIDRGFEPSGSAPRPTRDVGRWAAYQECSCRRVATGSSKMSDGVLRSGRPKALVSPRSSRLWCWHWAGIGAPRPHRTPRWYLDPVGAVAWG